MGRKKLRHRNICDDINGNHSDICNNNNNNKQHHSNGKNNSPNNNNGITNGRKGDNSRNERNKNGDLHSNGRGNVSNGHHHGNGANNVGNGHRTKHSKPSSTEGNVIRTWLKCVGLSLSALLVATFLFNSQMQELLSRAGSESMGGSGDTTQTRDMPPESTSPRAAVTSSSSTPESIASSPPRNEQDNLVPPKPSEPPKPAETHTPSPTGTTEKSFDENRPSSKTTKHSEDVQKEPEPPRSPKSTTPTSPTPETSDNKQKKAKTPKLSGNNQKQSAPPKFKSPTPTPTPKTPKQSGSKQKSSAVKSQQPTSSQPADNPAPQEIPRELRDFKPSLQGVIEPWEIVVDGRRIQPREIQHNKPNNSSVRIYLFENFLSARECEGLIGAHYNHVTERAAHQPIICFDSLNTLKRHLVDVKKSHVRVSVNDFVEGTMCLNESFSGDVQGWMRSRWSYSTAFYPGESPFSHTFSERVYRATGLNPQHGGKFQITSYAKGIGYKTHTDCVVHSGELRDRFATILVYLRDVPEGGETQFTELGVSVRPKAGTAVVWNNMDSAGTCDPLSLHRANTVTTGHKYIIQRWYYYQNFYALGRRVEEPGLPVRHVMTPRVSCDEYEAGSCRWYDEWNYEHITRYTDLKHSLH